jgi:single-strand DNA-binding protein
MNDTIMVRGLVATTPRHIVTSDGLAITSFRLATSQRRYDKVEKRWIDTDTNWYTISCFRSLAKNVAASVEKGSRVVVVGNLRIRDWENTDRSGTTVELEAETIGHDLFWGTTAYTRTPESGTEYADE